MLAHRAGANSYQLALAVMAGLRAAEAREVALIARALRYVGAFETAARIEFGEHTSGLVDEAVLILRNHRSRWHPPAVAELLRRGHDAAVVLRQRLWEQECEELPF